MKRGKLGITAMLVLALALPQAAAPVFGAESGNGLTTYAGRGSLDVKLIGRYVSGAELDEGGTEIVTYDKATKQAYSVNGSEKALDIIDMSGLKSGSGADTPGTQSTANLPLKKRIPLENLTSSSLKLDDITSVALSPNGSIIAVAAPAAPVTDKGYVIFLNTDGTYLNHVQVGVLPDMVTFTPDGKMVLTADEGQPNDDYSIDPPGSVSIIDISGGAASLTQANVTTAGFSGVDATGIRIAKPGAKFENDAEPEYIVISADSKKAYVVLQENNAMATLDIASKKFTSLKSLGVVDHSVLGHGFDGSDKDKAAMLGNWPTLGMHMPDGMSIYSANGKTYLLTANEGDTKDYDGYSEETRVKELKGKLALKAENYEGYTQKQLDEMMETLTDDDKLGRLKTTTANGVGASGKNEAIYSFGTRSFTVWNADDMSMVYDSADDFERITKRALPTAFNFDNSENAFDSRSDDKGPEPEAVITGIVGNKTYAFVGLERTSGMMAYDLTKPEQPVFDTFFSSRDYAAKGETPVGDVAPEGLTFVAAGDSPTGKALLLAAHEVSGTIAVYELTPSELQRIQIIHTNDVHSRVFEDGGMGYAKVGAIVDEYRAMNPNTLVLDGGDTTHGQTYSTLVRGSSIIDIMNEIKYDAMTSGNHDYNYGFDRLLELAELADYPILAANVKKADGSYVLPPSMIKEVAGLKIGIFGLATPETLYKTHPKNVEGLTFISPVKAAAEMVKELEPKVDIIIALAHLGTDGATLQENRSDYIVEQVAGIDLFVDGHSHEVVNRVIGDTLLVQDGEYAEQVGIVTLDIKDGKIIKKTSEFITAADARSMAPNAAVEKLIADTEKSQKAVLDEVIGQTAVKLDGEREIVRVGESNLGNLITDAMLEVSGADVALTNGGGIRASIDAGEITKGDIITVLPFGNYIVTMKVKGSEIKAALEVGASGYPSANGAFSHVGGVTYKIDAAKPKGERVHSITVKGAAIDMNKEYMLATNDFIAAGGDQYSMFVGKSIINHSAALDEAVITYIQANGGTVASKVEGRIVVEAGTESGKPVTPTPKPGVPAAPQDPQPEPGAPQTPPSSLYIVKSGDSLSSIARANGTTWQMLKKLNKLRNPHLIFPGQKLILR